ADVPALHEVALQLAHGIAPTPPFNRKRMLQVPAGFSIEVAARVPDARFMALAPNGDLLVSTPSRDEIILLRADSKGGMQTSTFASGLRQAHDMVFHALDGVMWLYVAQTNRITRAPYTPGDTRMQESQVVVDNLPDASTPELKGSYGHALKNIALNGNKLYVSIASTCNACASDTVAEPVRGAIHEYDAGGRGSGRLFARGVRNAEGLAFRPGTNELWVVVNNRDNIAYPYHKDFDGDGASDYGKVLPSFVDRNPPELLLKVRDGGNYGWPFCNSNPDGGLDDMPYERDVELNANGSRLDCSKLDRPAKGLPPHSAPLGMSFLPSKDLPPALAGKLAVALHGCWNCTSLVGNKVVLYALDRNGRVGAESDFVSGWVIDARKKQRWGRPVDVISDGKGGFYISDDYAGAIYRLRPEVRK
ncbi:MAG: sugar dehydrogenase, partial [Paucimonas sp.]|nr:sugar dehydrogenase [Paucimonas sp.]